MRTTTSAWRNPWVLLLCLAGALTVQGSARADDIRKVTIATNDLIFDPGTGQIYASVPSSAGSGGNSITPLNPVAATVGQSVFVGSEPGQLARSDDNQFLYVALNGASSVRRFDLATQTAEPPFPIGTPLQVEDMAVPPGQPHSVCIVSEDPRYSPHFAWTIIYDDGVARPDQVNGQDTIAYSASPGRLYAYNNSISQFDFDRFNISASGIGGPGSDANSNLISGYNLHIKFSDGLVFVNNGEVIDPEAATILGTFSGTGYNVPFAIQPGDGRAFFLTGSGATLTLRAYDVQTFLPAGTLDIPGVSGSPGSLIRWGRNGLAFRTSGNQVFLIRTALVPTSTSWTAMSYSVGGDNWGRALWDHTNGTAAVWLLNPQGQYVSQQQYGPFTGWTAQAIATGLDNYTRLLWTKPDGSAMLWLLDPQNRLVSQQTYGPFTGWSLRTISTGPDGSLRALWSTADGAAAVWRLDAQNRYIDQQQYGPYPGWTPKSLKIGPDGVERMLWTNGSGAAAFWRLDPGSRFVDQQNYGPFPGFTATDLVSGPGGVSHAVWSHTSGGIALWTLNSTGQYVGQQQYGPYGGWSLRSLPVGPDGDCHPVWDNTDGSATFWRTNVQGAFLDQQNYGPY